MLSRFKVYQKDMKAFGVIVLEIEESLEKALVSSRVEF
jgi:hypothetical protein